MKNVLLLLTLCTLLWAKDNECDTITRLNNNPAMISMFQLWEDEGNNITSLRTLSAVEDGIVYGYRANNNDDVVIIDVNPKVKKEEGKTVKTLSTIPRTYDNEERPLPMRKIGNLLYIIDSTDLLVYDVTDASSPQKKHSLSFPAKFDYLSWTNWDTMYVADIRSVDEKSFHIIDISNPAIPTIKESFINLNKGQQGYVGDNTFFNINRSTANSTIYSWDIPLKEEKFKAKFRLEYEVTNMFVKGDYTYISTPTNTHVYKHSDDLTNFTPIDTLDGAGPAMLEYKGLLVIAGGTNDSLKIYDISKPEAITQKAIFTQKQVTQKNIMAVDSTSNYLYTLTSLENWIDVIDLTSYLPEKIDTTFDRDTTHRISKDTTVKKDTVVNVDSIVTTLKKEVTTDSLFITIDSLANGVSFGIGYDTTAIISHMTLDSTVDTLGKSSIVQDYKPNTYYQASVGKSYVIALPSPVSGNAILKVFDLRGQLIDRKEILLTNANSVQWNSAGKTIASGYYVAVVSVGNVSVKKRFWVR